MPVEKPVSVNKRKKLTKIITDLSNISQDGKHSTKHHKLTDTFLFFIFLEEVFVFLLTINLNVPHTEFQLEPEASEFDLGKKIKTPRDIMLEELSLMKNKGSKMFKQRKIRVERFIYENNPDVFTSDSMVRKEFQGSILYLFLQVIVLWLCLQWRLQHSYKTIKFLNLLFVRCRIVLPNVYQWIIGILNSTEGLFHWTDAANST